MAEPAALYYRRDLALVHHLGFGFHADGCAGGILGLLEPHRRRGGTVLELGCGSGQLTRHLVDGGHRVIAADASPAMLELARAEVPGAMEHRLLVLPDDPLPAADAVVSVGHVVNYLPDAASIARAIAAMAAAVRPRGVLVFDVCDLRWGELRREQPAMARVDPEWAIITAFSLPTPDRYVRQMTTFVSAGDGSWRRDDERHDNILIDTGALPGLLSAHGVRAEIREELGGYQLPEGIVAVVGIRTG